jgi:DUF4097 and DUF4098 domain-containing protein YvlB
METLNRDVIEQRFAVENTRVEYSQTENKVRVQTKSDKGGLLNLARNVCPVDYEIEVPLDCQLHAEAVSADVQIQGISASVEVQTVSGDVTVDDISGDCRVTTVSGDATATRLRGALALQTTSGDARVRDSRLEHFNLNSVSGDFIVDTPLSTGQHYLAKTVSGDLRLLVPSGTGATVQMKTVSGDVVSDLPAEIIKSSRRSWQGRINGGGANVEMSSVSGDLRISRSGSSTETPTGSRETAASDGPIPVSDRDAPIETPPGQSSSDQTAPAETSEVLGALERGEITVEEAMARLNSL